MTAAQGHRLGCGTRSGNLLIPTYTNVEVNEMFTADIGAQYKGITSGGKFNASLNTTDEWSK